VESGKVKFGELRDYVFRKGTLAPNSSGRVEMLENLLNEYL
jgi:xylose isomerase